MRIKSELLWGDSIRNPVKIYDLLLNGKLPYGYYLLLCTADKRLEFVPSWMQNNKYLLSRECMVFGIARGKKEAYEMICHILRQIYVEHTYDSVSEYVGKILEEAVC
jgi:hypothetical protein